MESISGGFSKKDLPFSSLKGPSCDFQKVTYLPPFPAVTSSYLGICRAIAFNRAQFCPPGDIWQYQKTFLVVTTGVDGRVLLAPVGWRPELLQSILQAMGQPHSTAGPAQNINSAKLEEPSSRSCTDVSQGTLEPWQILSFSKRTIPIFFSRYRLCLHVCENHNWEI